MDENLTVFDMYSPVLPINYTYGGLGILAMVCNTFVLMVYMTKDGLRKHFILFVCMAMADWVNGLAFLMTGIVRLYKVWSLKDSDNYPVYFRYNCASEVNAALMLVGSQWPALLTLVLGVERFVAVKFPMKYYKIPKYYLCISIIILGIIIFSVAIALLVGLFFEGSDHVEFLCTISGAYAWEYSTFHYVFTSFGHLSGFLLNLTALILAFRAFKKAGMQKSNFQKEMAKIKLIFMVSFCSLIFVVVPNIILYLARWVGFGYETMGWLYCAFLFRSCFNIYVIGFANVEFKNRVFEILRKIVIRLVKTEVVPMSAINVVKETGTHGRADSLPKHNRTVTIVRHNNSF